jgi:3-keto-disaccharide hydrolase
MKATLGVLVGAALLLAVGVALTVDRPDDCEGWPEGAVRGGLSLRYGGYGKSSACRGGDDWEWRLSPRAAKKDKDTHAALALTEGRFGDLSLRVKMRTERQLRTPKPNPWEVAWVVWHYTDDKHFYYLTLKSNGWELGKEDPAYPGAQRFLATGDTPKFDPSEWLSVEVTQQGATMTASVGGRELTRVTDRERPYFGGHVGLYTEDATVYFTDLRVRG